jgi:uncharacterized protein (TIGR02231 family)
MNRCFSWLLSFLILYFIFDPAGAAAAPREVTLFPNTAKITDVSSVTLQSAGGETFRTVVVLPGQTSPDSLTAMLPSGSPLRIEDQSWRQITRQDDPRIAELRRQILNLKTERNGIFAGIQALDAQIQFWQAQAKAKAKTVEEADAISTLLAMNVKKAYQEKLALEPELQKADIKIKEFQEELNRMIGQKESLWEVTFLFSGPAPRETSLTLTYSLNGCGWTPLYRLDARPRDGLILFAWEAEIWQSSGIDWNQVETNLATLPPRSAIAAPALPPWIIQPRPEIRFKGRQKADALEAPAAGAMLLSETREIEPSEVRKSTYSVWSLGKRNIPAGTRQRMKVREETWSADFVHILRPSLTSQAFVRASVKPPEPKEIPSGQAIFQIDGAVLAKRPLSFAGQEGTFSFGVDPLVTADAILLSRKSGEKGFIADKQTHEWVWRFDLRNARNSAVRIRMEDPLPQVRDERIRLFFKYEPEPSEKTTDTLVWLLDLPAGQKHSLSSTVRIEAPKEMDLDLGWRR